MSWFRLWPGKGYLNFFCLVASIFSTLRAYDQQVEPLEPWLEKYPGEIIVLAARRAEVFIDAEENGVVVRRNEHKEYLVLADHATNVADTREYFSNLFDVNRFEAFTLVPYGRQYKKLMVGEVSKSVEIDEHVYFDDQFVYRYTYPGVMKGARLVSKSELVTRDPYVPVVFDFGNYVPSESLELTISCHPAVRLRYRLFGADTSIIRFERSQRGNLVLYTWRASNPNTYGREQNTPGLRYYLPHIIVQIAGYETDMGYVPVLGSLDDLFRHNYSHVSQLTREPAAEIRWLADSISAGASDCNEKVSRMFSWVQRQIKYVAIEDGKNGLVPREASLVLFRRYGDCKDKTSLLVSMIRSQGLRASFAWVGSRNLPYRYTDFPTVLNDDHMIAVWWDGDRPVVLDGTTLTHEMETVPAFIEGKECLIAIDSARFVIHPIPVTGPRGNQMIDSVRSWLVSDTLIASGVVSFTGELKADAMLAFAGKDARRKADILKSVMAWSSNKTIVKNVVIPDLKPGDKTFRILYSVQIPDYVVQTENNVYLNPYVNRFLHTTSIRSERKEPFESDMQKIYTLVHKIHIPAGKKVVKVPEGGMYTDSLFGFKENYKTLADAVLLEHEIRIEFRYLMQEQMQAFREMLVQLGRNCQKTISIEKEDTP